MSRSDTDLRRGRRFIPVALALCAAACSYPGAIRGRVVTEDGAILPCRADIQIRSPEADGKFTTVATISIESGRDFDETLDVKDALTQSPQRYWVVIDCKGYVPRVWEVESRSLDGVRRPILELGTVTVSALK